MKTESTKSECSTRKQAAQRLGVNAETLRYYEELGILPHPQRSQNGYRMYSNSDIQNMEFVLKAKSLGFPLKEIKEIVDFTENNSSICLPIKDKILKRLEDIEFRIDQLRSTQAKLKSLANLCNGNIPMEKCKILSSMQASN